MTVMMVVMMTVTVCAGMMTIAIRIMMKIMVMTTLATTTMTMAMRFMIAMVKYVGNGV